MVAPLYRGFSSVGKTGPDTAVYDTELVKQDLINHFQTRLGERVGRPSFGSIIYDLLHELMDNRTESLVQADVERVLAEDPRVETIEVVVNLSPDTHEIFVDTNVRFVEFNMEEWFQFSFGQIS